MLKRYSEEHPGEIELAAVCVHENVDRGQAYCDRFGFGRVYSDLDRMIEEEHPDACLVITPVSATRRVAGRVMELGVPVLIEKPPGARYAEAKELAEIAERTGTPHMVAFNRRFSPCTRVALEWAREHGPFNRVHFDLFRTGRKEAEFVCDSGIHTIDYLHMLGSELFGELVAARVARRTGAGGVFEYQIDTTFRGGGTGYCNIMPNAGFDREQVSLFGENTAILITLPWRTVEPRVELWSAGKLADSRVWPIEESPFVYGIYQEDAAFFDAIGTGTKPEPSLATVLPSVSLAEAVFEGKSWRSDEGPEEWTSRMVARIATRA